MIDVAMLPNTRFALSAMVNSQRDDDRICPSIEQIVPNERLALSGAIHPGHILKRLKMLSGISTMFSSTSREMRAT